MTPSLAQWKKRIDQRRAVMRTKSKAIKTPRTQINHGIAIGRNTLAFAGDRQTKPNQAGIIPAHFSEF